MEIINFGTRCLYSENITNLTTSEISSKIRALVITEHKVTMFMVLENNTKETVDYYMKMTKDQMETDGMWPIWKIRPLIIQPYNNDHFEELKAKVEKDNVLTRSFKAADKPVTELLTKEYFDDLLKFQTIKVIEIHLVVFKACGQFIEARLNNFN